MFKVFLVFLIALICNGCTSSSSSKLRVSKLLPSTEKVDKRLSKYATNQGCKMLNSGYMVCPKSMNK